MVEEKGGWGEHGFFLPRGNTLRGGRSRRPTLFAKKAKHESRKNRVAGKKKECGGGARPGAKTRVTFHEGQKTLQLPKIRGENVLKNQEKSFRQGGHFRGGEIMPTKDS